MVVVIATVPVVTVRVSATAVVDNLENCGDHEDATTITATTNSTMIETLFLVFNDTRSQTFCPLFRVVKNYARISSIGKITPCGAVSVKAQIRQISGGVSDSFSKRFNI